MYDPQRYYKNRSYYTKKGLSIQKRPQNPPKVIDRYLLPIYKNYFLDTKQLMPYTPNISFIEFKKRNDTTKTIGEFILDEVLAYNKNLTDITKIEFEPEVDVKATGSTAITKITLFDSSVSISTPNEYGIWSNLESTYESMTVTNNSKYIFTPIEGGWEIQMLPGVNEIITTGTISTSKNNINSSGNVTDTQYDSSTTSPIQNEYKGYTRNVEDNIFSLYFVSCVYIGSPTYTMIQVKVYF